VSFKLTNQSKSYAPFTAEFTKRSDSQFTVHPTKGILEPYGKEGTTFVVTYSPFSHSGIKEDRLIIQTNEVQWYFFSLYYLKVVSDKGAFAD